jgi:hypothetical protein
MAHNGTLSNNRFVPLVVKFFLFVGGKKNKKSLFVFVRGVGGRILPLRQW